MNRNKAKLKIADGVEAETIKGLREHFDLITLLEHYNSGRLLKWLYVNYPLEAEHVGALE